MYSQFFGSYLLSKQAVSPEQLIRAIEKQHTKHIRLGTLAIHAGLMDAAQVDSIIIRQTHEDKPFGELAVEEGYLTTEQMESLLAQQTPDYLLIGQSLVDDGYLTNVQLEALIDSYKQESQLGQLEQTDIQKDNLHTLIRNLLMISSSELPDYLIKYLTLLFSNLIRFIGEDFTPLSPTDCSEYTAHHCSSQVIDGEFKLSSFFDMDTEAAIAFASRYAGDSFMEYDDYVQAAIEDFLNLHNGLFNVNMSNESSIELLLNPPVSMENTCISNASDMFLFPIIYPFGTLNFLIQL